ncbi:MAG: CDP-diacylglycerol--serine O-phosphatidyltransferase [Pelagibacteraceae bacterium]|tara:strand:- start:177 stop:965 length:789 start_codon:yes stop_codon:yes gene_type:complete
MQEKKFTVVHSKKSRYILPNLLTLIGVCLGISSIKFALDENFSLAVIFLIFAALLDALDGRIARLIKGTSEFGKELDSLTDFVSFGIAPAFVIYFWELKNLGKIGWAITLIYSVCCVLRLARFNLTKIYENESWKMNYFQGIPSPAGGILILLPLIYELSNLDINLNVRSIAPYLEIFIAILLISKLPTFSFKKITIQSKMTIFILFTVGILFVSLIFYTFETLLLIGLFYILTLPLSFYFFNKQDKKFKDDSKEDDHEDIL